MRRTVSCMNSEKSSTGVFEYTPEEGPSLEIGRLLEIMGPDINAAEIAAVLYVSESTVRRWMKRPNMALSAYKADRFAMCIGLHPFQIWEWDWVDTK